MSDFLEAVTDFHRAALGRDDAGQEEALEGLRAGFGEAPPEELYEGASLLADVLHAVPAGRDAQVAVVIAACVELGADPAACAEPILHRAQLALEAPRDVPLWESAVAAVLATKYIRTALLPKPELLAVAREVASATGEGRYLAEVLAVLDDEPLVVLHRPTGQGFEFVMSGVADNAQLHTLLAARLVSPGHLEGAPPSPDAVAACLAETADAPTQYDATAAFTLVAPDGSPLPYALTPADIPVVDGTRLLVLDPPGEPATWTVSRGFTGMAAELTLQRRLSTDGVTRWLAHVALPPQPEPVAVAVPEKRSWWKRS